jgi:hypothetical protein
MNSEISQDKYSLILAILILEKFKILHGFNIVLAMLFSLWAHFHLRQMPQAKTALFGAPRFRAPATPPPRGAVSCFATPTIACASAKSLSLPSFWA